MSLNLNCIDMPIKEFCGALSLPGFAETHNVHVPAAQLEGAPRGRLPQRPNLFQVAAKQESVPPTFLQKMLGPCLRKIQPQEAPRQASEAQKLSLAENIDSLFRPRFHNHGLLRRQLHGTRVNSHHMQENLKVMKTRVMANATPENQRKIALHFGNAIRNLKSFQGTSPAKIKFQRAVKQLTQLRRAGLLRVPRGSAPPSNPSLCSRVTKFMAITAFAGLAGLAGTYKFLDTTDPTQLAMGAGALALFSVASRVISSCCGKTKKVPAVPARPAAQQHPAAPKTTTARRAAQPRVVPAQKPTVAAPPQLSPQDKVLKQLDKLSLPLEQAQKSERRKIGGAILAGGLATTAALYFAPTLTLAAAAGAVYQGVKTIKASRAQAAAPRGADQPARTEKKTVKEQLQTRQGKNELLRSLEYARGDRRAKIYPPLKKIS